MILYVSMHMYMIITYVQGGPHEEAECSRRLHSLYCTLLCKNAWNNLLQLYSNYYRYATILIPPLALCPTYFAGDIQFGTISQATYAFDKIEVCMCDVYVLINMYAYAYALYCNWFFCEILR